ncbi:B-cell antigen receptor complex-associated protein beta chain [Electrophorus electricus]|uniref:Ig-like domain-containing protein n=1 Tax=Electrophorus electricus TaxID=8005 RepID=A0A4W4FS11_ELEEL|nr:B-cell antigen receptor complex-associated protein beta chain [Electrophorus electricus]
MYHLSFNCFLLALVNLSVTTAHFNIYQVPRFYSTKVGRRVSMLCYCKNLNKGKLQVEWYKAEKYIDTHRLKLENSRAINDSGSLHILKVEVKDSGIYFCKINKTWGLGTELQVIRHIDQTAAERRSKMKDLIIFIQTFFLMLCIALFWIKCNKLVNKEEAVYEEPEDDHTYEGLEIEHCGGDLYEDIHAYSQCQEAEESLESPDRE